MQNETSTRQRRPKLTSLFSTQDFETPSFFVSYPQKYLSFKKSDAERDLLETLKHEWRNGLKKRFPDKTIDQAWRDNLTVNFRMSF